MDALKRRDARTARRVLGEDTKINDKRYAIENAIVIAMATQQPMAHDLRTLAAFLEISTELERMGDYAKGIAKVVLRLGDVDIPIPMRELEQMVELGVGMLHRALSAFINEDSSVASQIPLEDDQVDELYNRVHRIVVNSMIANPEIIDHANLLLWVAHNLERLADRVTNICERTVFVTTGELLEFEQDDNEEAE
jgi:phosphate transport system protein